MKYESVVKFVGQLLFWALYVKANIIDETKELNDSFQLTLAYRKHQGRKDLFIKSDLNISHPMWGDHMENTIERNWTARSHFWRDALCN